jgi:hypothetical protein
MAYADITHEASKLEAFQRNQLGSMNARIFRYESGITDLYNHLLVIDAGRADVQEILPFHKEEGILVNNLQKSLDKLFPKESLLSNEQKEILKSRTDLDYSFVDQAVKVLSVCRTHFYTDNEMYIFKKPVTRSTRNSQVLNSVNVANSQMRTKSLFDSLVNGLTVEEAIQASFFDIEPSQSARRTFSNYINTAPMNWISGLYDFSENTFNDGRIGRWTIEFRKFLRTDERVFYL